MCIKIGVVGAGSMGTNHLRVLRTLPEDQINLVGIAEIYAPALLQAVKRFHVEGYSDYRSMIERTHPDLVALVVPTQLHYEVAAFALEHGCHVLIEKPITANEREAWRLIELARATHRKIAVGHIERFNPAIIELKRRLAMNELGRIFHLYARRLGPFPPRIRDVGVILDLATHDIDVMRYLVDGEVEHVYAETRHRVHRKYEDLLLGVLRFTNEAIGVLDTNWLTPTKVRELSITGERGMFLVNYLTQDLSFYANDYPPADWDALRSFVGVSEGTKIRLKVQKAEPLLLEYQDICAAIQNDTLPSVTGEDGLAALQVAVRLSGSAQARKEAVPVGVTFPLR